MTVLDIRDLSLSIGQTPILKNVSLSVAPADGAAISHDIQAGFGL